MNTRSKPWEIAADLEAAAKAVLAARDALDAIHISAIAAVEAIPGTEHIDRYMVAALMALSDKYQAIADAEEDA